MKHAALIPLLLLAACSKGAEQVPQPAASQEATAIASDAAIATEPAVAAAAAPVSRYTTFKDCKLVKSGEGEDWSVSRCAGLGGYDLQIDYGDARDELTLLEKGRPPVKLNLFALGNGGFNSLGETAEWRGAAGGEGFEPSTLIIRNNVSEDAADSSKQTPTLVVVSLKQSCVVAQLRPQAGQNEAARAIADGPRRPCLQHR